MKNLIRIAENSAECAEFNRILVEIDIKFYCKYQILRQKKE